MPELHLTLGARLITFNLLKKLKSSSVKSPMTAKANTSFPNPWIWRDFRIPDETMDCRTVVVPSQSTSGHLTASLIACKSLAAWFVRRGSSLFVSWYNFWPHPTILISPYEARFWRKYLSTMWLIKISIGTGQLRPAHTSIHSVQVW